MIPIGIVGFGTFFPQRIETAADLAAQIDIPENVPHEKMGIRQRHIAGEAETTDFTPYIQQVLDSGADAVLPIWAGDSSVTLF